MSGRVQEGGREVLMLNSINKTKVYRVYRVGWQLQNYIVCWEKMKMFSLESFCICVGVCLSGGGGKKSIKKWRFTY